MLNTEKIKLMCQLALFEEREGKGVFEINKYYKSDYISKHLFTTLVHYTLCFLLILLICGMLKINDIFLLLSLDFLKETGRTVLFIYVAGMFLVAVFSYITLSERYDASHRLELFYSAKLNKLLKLDLADTETQEELPHRIDSKRSLYREERQRGQSRGRKGRKAGR